MKPQYQTRYESLHESYQKWLTGFTRHAVSWGMCHPNIYYFHNLMVPDGYHSMVKNLRSPLFPKACTGLLTVMIKKPYRPWTMIWW